MTKIIPISDRGQVTIPKEARAHFKAPYIMFGKYRNAYYLKISSPEIAEPENWLEELAQNAPQDSEGEIRSKVAKELEASLKEYQHTGESYSLQKN